jgi:hypothetical protein
MENVVIMGSQESNPVFLLEEITQYLLIICMTYEYNHHK